MTWSVAARLFHSIPRPWLNPNWEESWLARTSWVSGFFSSRGKPLVLWRGAGVCPPRKKEGGLPEPLTVLAVNPKENYSPDPWWFLANGAWGVPFSLTHISALRANGPQCQKTPFQGRAPGHRPGKSPTLKAKQETMKPKRTTGKP